LKKRIHIFGASGSGTTTLAKVLADVLNIPHFDTDIFFWIQTTPPFQLIRKRVERQKLLRQVLTQNNSWVLSGSLCGWGDFAIPMFDLLFSSGFHQQFGCRDSKNGKLSGTVLALKIQTIQGIKFLKSFLNRESGDTLLNY